MHFTSDASISPSDKVWAFPELQNQLHKYYANRELLLPDDSFYGNLSDKEALEALGARIKRQLKIRTPIVYHFSKHASEPGHCHMTKKQAVITVPNYFIGNPLLTAACLAHLLTHVSLAEHKLQHIDKSENERLVDMASIASGLGLVIINGVQKGGWRLLLKHHKSCLGYLTPGTFSDELKRVLPHEKLDRCKATVVPWERKRLFGSLKVRNQTSIVGRAARFHSRSIRRAWLLALGLIILIAVTYALQVQRPTYSDTTLYDLEKKASFLDASYQSCRQRLANLTTKPISNDITSERIISAETGRCKSLENRYNAAAQEYNRYLELR